METLKFCHRQHSDPEKGYLGMCRKGKQATNAIRSLRIIDVSREPLRLEYASFCPFLLAYL